LDTAERGEIQIIISALVIAEVLKNKGAKPIGKENRNKVIEFFQNDYITVINVDRWIACDAQELYWEHNIFPRDAIHVATALKQKVNFMETYDDKLLKRSGEVGSPPLQIREPGSVQLGLHYEQRTGKEESEE
jgi:predicted nucleic acid-binding protein